MRVSVISSKRLVVDILIKSLHKQTETCTRSMHNLLWICRTYSKYGMKMSYYFAACWLILTQKCNTYLCLTLHYNRNFIFFCWKRRLKTCMQISVMAILFWKTMIINDHRNRIDATTTIFAEIFIGVVIFTNSLDISFEITWHQCYYKIFIKFGIVLKKLPFDGAYFEAIPNFMICNFICKSCCKETWLYRIIIRHFDASKFSVKKMLWRTIESSLQLDNLDSYVFDPWKLLKLWITDVLLF